jgi:hypothetical protein
LGGGKKHVWKSDNTNIYDENGDKERKQGREVKK